MDTPQAEPDALPTNLQTTIEQLAESIRTEANVRTVFGEPIKLDSRTVVPVATIAISLGAGMGMGTAMRRKGKEAGTPFRGGGGGGGLDVKVVPVGFVTESGDDTAFVPIAADDSGMVGRARSALWSALRR